jgi:hypothetical protein
VEGVVLGTPEEGIAWIGRESELYAAPDPIDLYSVRHFCELVEDADPRYRGTAGPDPLAPPGSLMIWCAPSSQGLDEAAPEPPRLHRRIPLPGERLIVTEVDTIYRSRIRIGDRLAYRERVAEVTPRTTRLGDGFSIRIERHYQRDDGTPVAVETTTCFRY